MNRKFIAKFLSFLMLCSTSNFLINTYAMSTSRDGNLNQDISEKFSKELENATKTLEKHPGVLELNGEIAVVGDIHGDVLSINAIIEKLTPWLNEQQERKVLFLGDIFDRGDTTTSLYLFLRFFNHFNSGDASTHRVFVLRGNHETEEFYLDGQYDRRENRPAFSEPVISENQQKILEYMDQLPYAAILNSNTFAVHGGIPKVKVLDMDRVTQLFDLNSQQDKSCPLTHQQPYRKELYHMIWSDFDPNAQKYTKSERGIGYIYGWKQLKMFFETLAKVNPKYKNVKHIIHGHKHTDGPFQQLEHNGMTNTTVISSIHMCMACADSAHCSVAVVSPDKKPKEKFIFQFDFRNNINPVINVHKNNPLKSGLTGFGLGVATTAIIFMLENIIVKKTDANKKLNPHDKKSKVAKQSKHNEVYA